MATDTLSPPSTPASDLRATAGTVALASAAPAPAPHSAIGDASGPMPNPLYISVAFKVKGQSPVLEPEPVSSTKHRKRGYQFADDSRETRMIFEIVKGDRKHYAFTGCALSAVTKMVGGTFPMPESCRYTILNAYTLVVECTFTPGVVQQVSVEPQYLSELTDQVSFDPQVGNDGGNAAPPAPMPERDTHGA